MHLHRSALIATLIPFSVMFCASAPPQEGVEVRGGAGYSSFEYQSGGCSGPQYINRADEVRLHGHISYRHKTGFGVTSELNIAHATVNESKLINEANYPADVPRSGDQLGRTIFSPVLVVRPSFHWKYVGLEIGAGVATGSIISEYETNNYGPMLSGRAWAGYPKYAYIWADVVAGPLTPDSPLTAGAGIARDQFRLSAGAGNNVLLAAGQYQVIDSIWLGAKLHTATKGNNSGGMLTIALTPDL